MQNPNPLAPVAEDAVSNPTGYLLKNQSGNQIAAHAAAIPQMHFGSQHVSAQEMRQQGRGSYDPIYHHTKKNK